MSVSVEHVVRFCVRFRRRGRRRVRRSVDSRNGSAAVHHLFCAPISPESNAVDLSGQPPISREPLGFVLRPCIEPAVHHQAANRIWHPSIVELRNFTFTASKVRFQITQFCSKIYRPLTSGHSTEGWFDARPRYGRLEVLKATFRQAGIMMVHYIQGSGGLR
jgi:hypothetical protein